MDKNQIGMGLAGCLLTASTIATLFKLGILTQKHIDQIIADSHAMLENPDFPDCDSETKGPLIPLPLDLGLK